MQLLKSWDESNSHQVAAINALEELIPDELLDRQQDWVIMYKEAQYLDVSAEDKAARQALSKRKRQKRLE